MGIKIPKRIFWKLKKIFFHKPLENIYFSAYSIIDQDCFLYNKPLNLEMLAGHKLIIDCFLHQLQHPKYCEIYLATKNKHLIFSSISNTLTQINSFFLFFPLSQTIWKNFKILFHVKRRGLFCSESITEDFPSWIIWFRIFE